MSFDALPDSVLPEIFTHVTPGLLLQLSTVSLRCVTACLTVQTDVSKSSRLPYDATT